MGTKILRGLFVALVMLVLACPPVFAAAVQVEFLMSGMTDTSGELLAGGLVYTYTAGTTSAKSTWTNSSKSSVAANPVVLDAYGRANVYADGSYKFVVKTSAGVTLYTWDNLEYVSTVSPSTISVTTATITGATIASLTTTAFTISNGTISSATISNATIGAPEITTASMSNPVLYNASLSAPVISNATFSGDTSIATPTAANDVANKGYIDGRLDGSVGSGIATPTTSTQAANKGYVDDSLASYTVNVAAVFSVVSSATFTLSDTTIVGTTTQNFSNGTNVDSFSVTNSTTSTGTYVFDITYSVRAASWSAGPLDCMTWAHDGTSVYDGLWHHAQTTIATYTSGSSLQIIAPGQGAGHLSGVCEVSPASSKTIYLRGNQYLWRNGADAIFKLPSSSSWFKYFRLR